MFYLSSNKYTSEMSNKINNVTFKNAIVRLYILKSIKLLFLKHNMDFNNFMCKSYVRVN